MDLNANFVVETELGSQPISGHNNEEPPLLNTKALSEHAKTYELEKFEKNLLIIFNNKYFDDLLTRHRTDIDIVALRQTFLKFGFVVEEYRNLTKKEIEDELKAFSRRNFTDYGCVAIAVLTHGANNGLLRAKDRCYSEEEITNHCKAGNNPTLVTKPKIIIIQASRDSATGSGVTLVQEGGESVTTLPLTLPSNHTATLKRDLDEPYFLPAESDMLILHSSFSGRPSYRNNVYGSWFIQELCNKIECLAATEDLESILIEVKKEVAINRQHEQYNRRTSEIDIDKQMPVITSTLIRKLYLRKFDATTAADSCVIVESRESVSKNTTRERKAYLQFSYMKNLIIGRRTFM